MRIIWHPYLEKELSRLRFELQKMEEIRSKHIQQAMRDFD
jgi:hypothetical protein